MEGTSGGARKWEAALQLLRTTKGREYSGKGGISARRGGEEEKNSVKKDEKKKRECCLQIRGERKRSMGNRDARKMTLLLSQEEGK